MSTAFETVEAIRNRAVTARAIVETSLKSIHQQQDGLGAMLHICDDHALHRASDIDTVIANGGDAGRLAGLPIVIKDNMCTRSGPTTCASRILEDFHAPYDAHVVERLESAGAIIVAKSNLDEFAMGSSTENSGFFPTRNPWDPSRVAGGSSGGSAAAIAAGVTPCALGSDTGGSIRLPAAFCGVVGLKPTYGRVSRYGLVAFGSSLDQIGPMTRDARDAALVLSTIAGHDPRDSTSVDRAVPGFESWLDDRPGKLRIGVAAEYFGGGLSESVRRPVDQALATLQRDGAELVEIHMPHMRYGVAAYYVIATAEASSNLARYDGVHYGHRSPDSSELIDLYSRSRAEGFGAEVKRRIMLGTFVLSSGYYDAYYLKASKVRTLIKRDFESAFQNVDVIASPVAPTTAFALGEKVHDPLAMYLADVYTTPASLAGTPAVSIPCGFDDGDRPVGLQLMAPWFEEARLLSVAHRFQQMTDHHRRRPSAVPAGPHNEAT